MAQNRIKAKGRREKGTYAGIPHAVTRSREYASLTAVAVKMLVDITDQFNGKNNGDFQATRPFMQRKGWKSKATIRRALDELVDKGFIVISRQGGRNLCMLYALTFLAIDDCKGKLDIEETRTPLSFWKKSLVPKLGQLDPAMRSTDEPE